MSNPARYSRKKIFPILLLVFYLLISAVLIYLKQPFWIHPIILLAILYGFWMGNLSNPAVSYRKKKVKKQSLDILKLNEQFKIHSAALQSAANGIIITDTKGIIQWINPGFSRLTGYDYEECVGRTLGFLNSGVHDHKFFEHMWHEIKNGRVWHNEIVNKRKDGSLYTEEMTITPVLDENSQIKSFVAIKQDISERKRLEEIMQEEKKRMETELDVARNIQMSMLRKNDEELDQHPDVDIFAQLIPAREVGGDFYDYFWLDDENLCFVIGDVSGKGVPAALFMAVTKTLLKSAAGSTKSTAKALTQVNNEISRDNENFMFITVFMGILNTTTCYLSYSNAGHNTTYLLNRTDQELKELKDLHGVVVGAMDNTIYNETVIRINRGDSIFVYTDGITEARNLNNDLFSDEKLASILKLRLDSSPSELVQHIFEEVKRHENGAEPADDITILNIHFKEQSQESVIDYFSTNLPNTMEAIHEFSKQFTSFAEKHEMKQEPTQQLQIVFDELLSNIVKYAYPDENQHEIEIKVRYYGQKLTVTILDDGKPFNPFDSMDVDTQAGISDREIGGLGIHLVKFLVDDYQYEYKEQISMNSTHFIKNLSEE